LIEDLLAPARSSGAFADLVQSFKQNCDMDNPYSTPTNESVTLPMITMYSPGQIAWATYLGAPIAGCWLLALNYRRLGDARAANLALISGLIGTVLLLALAFVLPERFPKFVVPAAYTFVMYRCVRALQGKVYEDRLANGANKGSVWVATGIGILCLILILTAIVLPVIALVIFAPK
jgi:hypothetical protein